MNEVAKLPRYQNGLAAFVAATLLIQVLEGCSGMETTKSLTISGVTYNFPSQHVHGILASDQGGPYVRLQPTDEMFLLIYSQDAFRPNQQGASVPTIPYVNDVPGRDIEVIDTEGGPVVCDRQPRRYGCGLRIEDQGIGWNLIFNRHSVENVKSIRDSALNLLSAYRS